MNKVAIITGASRGIGLAIARKLHEEGASVALCARSAIEDIPNERALAVAMDVRDQKNVEAGVRRILDRFGKIDIVVNNAGISASLQSMPPTRHPGWISSRRMSWARITSHAPPSRTFPMAAESS